MTDRLLACWHCCNMLVVLGAVVGIGLTTHDARFGLIAVVMLACGWALGVGLGATLQRMNCAEHGDAT